MPFSRYCALAVSFEHTHPLLSSHIVPNTSLRTLPMISCWTLLPFPSYFKFHNVTYLRIDDSTHNLTIPPHMAWTYYILNLQNNMHTTTKNISLSNSLISHIILIISISIFINFSICSFQIFFRSSVLTFTASLSSLRQLTPTTSFFCPTICLEILNNSRPSRHESTIYIASRGF